LQISGILSTKFQVRVDGEKPELAIFSAIIIEVFEFICKDPAARHKGGLLFGDG
jgi:hypothetical protein